MKHKLITLLSVTSSERKGIIVLVIIIAVLAVIQVFNAFHRPSLSPLSDTFFIKEMQLMEFPVTSGDSALVRMVPASGEYELFQFDPNTVSASELKRLGINTSLARTWMNYRRSGGKFRIPGDVKKIYGMNEALYLRLEPFVKIGGNPGKPALEPVLFQRPENVLSDINSADSSDLLEIRGIGPVLAGRIIKYRKLLGGYAVVGQLHEVYGLTDSLVHQMDSLYFADTAGISRISVNTASEEMLSGHPYIGRFAARGIINYRKSVDRILNIEELRTNGIFSGAQFEKVKNYLVI